MYDQISDYFQVNDFIQIFSVELVKVITPTICPWMLIEEPQKIQGNQVFAGSLLTVL